MKIRGAVLERIGDARPFAATRPIRVTELDLEEPGPGEVLVAIEAAGICHSDLSVVDGNRPRPVPMLLGHEAAGSVARLGDGVAGVQVGQRVVMTFLPRCGECDGCRKDGRAPCSIGSAANSEGRLLSGARRLSLGSQTLHHHLGVSAFATHAVVDQRSLVPVDDEVPAHLAALFGCAVLTGGGAVLNVARPTTGTTLAVVGLGGVGLAAALVALAYDGVRVIGIDPMAEKRHSAKRVGLHETMTPAEADLADLRADVVIEAVGRASAFQHAYTWTAPGGITITVGLPSSDETIDLAPLGLVAEGRTVVGSYLGSAVPSRDIPIFVEMWRAGRLPVEHLVSSFIRLDQLNEGMDRLASGSVLRQIIDFSKEAAR